MINESRRFDIASAALEQACQTLSKWGHLPIIDCAVDASPYNVFKISSPDSTYAIASTEISDALLTIKYACRLAGDRVSTLRVK